MQFEINEWLLSRARRELAGRQLFWIVGGLGAGKTTVSTALAAQYRLPVYDVDAQAQNLYQARFQPDRHPANTARLSTTHSLSWLLNLSWEDYDQFGRAALVEYLDLLVEDVHATPPDAALLVNGGANAPAVLARALPARQIVALAIPERMRADEWAADPAHQAIKEAIEQLPTPQAMWRKFQDFNHLTHQTIVSECQNLHIPICWRDEATPVAVLAAQVAQHLRLES